MGRSAGWSVGRSVRVVCRPERHDHRRTGDRIRNDLHRADRRRPATTSSVITSSRVALGNDRAVLHRDQVVAEAAGLVEVVQHQHDRAVRRACSGRRAGPAPRTGGSDRGTWSARRAAGCRSPARAPSRSRPAAADHRTARRSAGRRSPGRRSTSSPAATASSSALVHCRIQPWRGYRPRPTRSATVMPSGAVGDCGSRPSLVATSRVGIDWMLLPSSSTVPCDGFSSRASVFSSVDLPHALAPTITVILPVGISHRQVVDDLALVVADRELLRPTRLCPQCASPSSATTSRPGSSGPAGTSGTARRPRR